MKPSKPLLSFGAVLAAQLDGSLPNSSLKRLLRALKDSHQTYGESYRAPQTGLDPQGSPAHFNPFTLSQTPQPASNPSCGMSPIIDPMHCNMETHQQEKIIGSSIPAATQGKSSDSKKDHSQSPYASLSTGTPDDSPRTQEAPSRLRRKRRHSRRPISISVQLFHNEKHENLGVTDRIGKVQQRKCTTFSNSSNEPPAKKTAKSTPQLDEPFQVQKETPTARQQFCDDSNVLKTAKLVGSEINKILNDMVASCPPEHYVQWNVLRPILRKNPSFVKFCRFVDRTFYPHDQLGAGVTTSQGRQRRPCVFYSNLFWENAWRDFCKRARLEKLISASQSSPHSVASH